ncbi:MAG: glycosyl transferase [Hyphomicrobiales bacterium]|nr:glycosyl transferase [Hyphomicrobiales bacterium]
MALAGELIIVGIVALLASAALTGLALRALSRYGVYDQPNARSLHATAKPRGGGAAAVLVVLALWAWLDWPLDRGDAVPIGAALILAVIGALDDLKELDWRPRLGAQACAVAFAVFAGPWSPVILGGEFAWLDRALVGLALLWFVNLYNFMDGIDGLATSETAIVCLGVVAVAAVAGLGGGLGAKGAVLGGAALGFLAWNWHPARIFLGDVGSVTLGFLVAWLLIELARSGALAAAIILPGFFLLDASATLIRHTLCGVPFWLPHRDHAYQRAVQGGMSHAGVVVRIAGLNLALVALALFSLAAPFFALVAAAAATVGLWTWLSTRGGDDQSLR